jgi:LPXTG-site transpeptidase (sortase) family protein
MQDLFERIWEKKITFLGTFFLIFLFSYLVLMALDFLPEPPVDKTGEKQQEQINEENPSTNDFIEENDIAKELTEEELGVPLSMSINSLDRKIAVLNPKSREIADLDSALLEGVVRHPDSALLGQTGNVFILGHSSYLPQVFNKNFQAFNGIQNLKWGDTIEIASEDKIYEYRVEKVYRARAQDVTVPIAGDEKLLTLATCNSFGTVDDRYIVEAKQINERAL